MSEQPPSYPSPLLYPGANTYPGFIPETDPSHTRVLNERATEMLNEFPAFMRDDPHVQAICHVRASETERMLAVLDELRDALIPVRAGEMLMEAWEASVHLPRNPEGKTIEQRRDAVVARLQSFLEDSSGAAWVASLRARLGVGWSYEEDDETEFLLRFYLPWESGSSQFLQAQRIIEEERPAAWDIFVSTAEGFRLDLSQMDVEPFGN